MQTNSLKTVMPARTLAFFSLFAWMTALVGLLVASPAVAEAGSIVLHSFWSDANDGVRPYGGLVEATDGFLYGTTQWGATSDITGTIYRVDLAGTNYSVMYRFRGGDEDQVMCALIQASDGAMYGVTYGASGYFGTVFRYTPGQTNITILRRFTGAPDAAHGWATMLEASDGMLYGTTDCGGVSDVGAVYRISKDGSGYEVIKSFGFKPEANYPYAGLVEGDNGELFGTTYGGGLYDAGTVFRLNKDGSDYRILASFGGIVNGVQDSRKNYGTLIKASDGRLYGTTTSSGSVFSINQDGSDYKILRLFGDLATGRNIESGLLEAQDGFLYGTTQSGGIGVSGGNGLVFKMSKDGAFYEVVHLFNQTDARASSSTLIQARDGNFYGTGSYGGLKNGGTAFGIIFQPTAWMVPGANYAAWVPEAGPDENTPGNQLPVKLELRGPDGLSSPPAGSEAIFEVSLDEVSGEPGTSLNTPAPGRAASSPDLKLLPDASWAVSSDGLAATSKVFAVSATINVAACDWGAYGRISTIAVLRDKTRISGSMEKSALPYVQLPKDDNGNHVADSWEEAKGILSSNHPANWEDLNLPSGHAATGDGISLYERYRGFFFYGQHERLDPSAKHVFVYDHDGAVLESLLPNPRIGNLETASGCRVRFVEDDTWTGPGFYSDKKRIVNFNNATAHVCDQHAIDVRLVNVSTTDAPKEYVEAYLKATGEVVGRSLDDGPLGQMYPDVSAPAKLAGPGGCYLVNIYADKILNDARETVIHNSWGLPPYLSTWGTYNDIKASWLPDHPDKIAFDTMKREVVVESDNWLASHPDDLADFLWLRTLQTLTHECGHAIGIADLAEQKGHLNCFMRYILSKDGYPDPDDRLHVGNFNWWPRIFCLESVHTASGVPCFNQIRVSDNPAK